MHKPHETWAPKLAMRLVLGEMSTVVLDTQRFYQISYTHSALSLSLTI